MSNQRPKTASPIDENGDPYFTKYEIQRLYKRFLKLDKDGNGIIDKDEFLSIPQISSNPLASRIISIFDEDKKGVDFKNFIQAISSFSTRGSKEQRLKCTIILISYF